MRQKVTAEFGPDKSAYVELEHLPNGEWMVSDHRDGKVRVFDDEEEARESVVATMSMLAAQAAAEIIGTKHRVWDVTIEPAKDRSEGD